MIYGKYTLPQPVPGGPFRSDDPELQACLVGRAWRQGRYNTGDVVVAHPDDNAFSCDAITIIDAATAEALRQEYVAAAPPAPEI